ncbi:MAG: DUF2490 domain-containing protein [Pyrinomonadaceae bacterium]|nr:DUF2490 domain-containing protein [Pyrinomonadaceae bacterium]
MTVNVWRLVCLVALAAAFSSSVHAQQDSDTVKQIWPEVDIYIPLNEKFRLFFLATTTKNEETRDNTEGQVGAHVDYQLNKKVSLRAGYRYAFSLGGSDPYKEHRIIFEQTLRQPLPLQVLFSDRNREDLRWVNGEFSARYRNRVTLEREFKVLNRPVTPYGSAEVFYDSRFNAWSRNRLTVGAQFSFKRGAPLISLIHPKKQLVLDVSLARQNDSRSQPSHVRALGIAFSIYF